MKQLYILLFALIVSVPAFSQGPNRQADFELYKAKRVSYMTEKMQLTPDEAQKFWPIYNEYDRLRMECHDKRRDLERRIKENYDRMSESDFKKLNSETVALSVRECELTKTYNDKFLSVLPAKKVVLIGPSENEFRFKMIREFRQREKDGTQKDR